MRISRYWPYAPDGYLTSYFAHHQLWNFLSHRYPNMNVWIVRRPSSVSVTQGGTWLAGSSEDIWSIASESSAPKVEEMEVWTLWVINGRVHVRVCVVFLNSIHRKENTAKKGRDIHSNGRRGRKWYRRRRKKEKEGRGGNERANGGSKGERDGRKEEEKSEWPSTHWKWRGNISNPIKIWQMWRGTLFKEKCEKGITKARSPSNRDRTFRGGVSEDRWQRWQERVLSLGSFPGIRYCFEQNTNIVKKSNILNKLKWFTSGSNVSPSPPIQETLYRYQEPFCTLHFHT